MKKKLLKNVYYPVNDRFEKGNVLFDQKIRTFIYKDDILLENVEIIEGNGEYMLPGGIDSHVHFNTPGFENHETFEKGTKGAVKGGVTTIIDMPCTSLPPVVDEKGFNNKLNIIKDNAWCNFALHGGISGNLFEDNYFDVYSRVKQLKTLGVTALKIYTVSGMETFKALDNFQIFETMKAAVLNDIPIMIHAEDPSIVNTLTTKIKNSGKKSPLDYADSRPVEVELLAINNVAYMAKLTGAKIHIVHISSAEGVELVNEWQKKGTFITCETCPHYLEFNENDLNTFGGILKTAPVVKNQEDSEALWNYLKKGNISFITTDHAPCNVKTEKNTGDIWKDYAGIPGVEIVFAYILSEGYISGKLSLKRLIEISSQNAAKFFGLYPAKGNINPGADADFILFNPDENFTVEGQLFESIGKYTPFEGRKFKGKIKRVFISGEIVVDNDKIIKKIGNFVK
ncbi:MAG: amidohydrolase family protein [Candidatus Muirbacterium halophilum]|nr:amidohydrolase family protein [Candidatus Muirbacterium halophilum]MCK9474368.1 amidohydrolase family protein [Candidatus Muirbacterium halophilum]